MSLYTPGVATLENIVELINPPIKKIASGEINGLEDTDGQQPADGRRRSEDDRQKADPSASRMASSTPLPCSRN